MRRAACLLLVLGACNTPTPPNVNPVTTATPSVTAPVPIASAAVSASAASTASAPSTAPSKPGACTADADCRTWSSYCAEAPCACRVLGAGDPDPRCRGPATSNVRCFADPCMKKSARCEGGACVLATGAPTGTR